MICIIRFILKGCIVNFDLGSFGLGWNKIRLEYMEFSMQDTIDFKVYHGQAINFDED